MTHVSILTQNASLTVNGMLLNPPAELVRLEELLGPFDYTRRFDRKELSPMLRFDTIRFKDNNLHADISDLETLITLYAYLTDYKNRPKYSGLLTLDNVEVRADFLANPVARSVTENFEYIPLVGYKCVCDGKILRIELLVDLDRARVSKHTPLKCVSLCYYPKAARRAE